MPNFPPKTPQHVTWAAEDRANESLTHLLETTAGHICGNCRNPYSGRSALRCRNETGGA